MGKKSGKKKLPKKIAGVKVPKDVRKAGNRLVRLAETPLAREIALAALAAGLAARKDVRKAASGAGEEASASAGWVSAALGAAAAEAGRRVIQAPDEDGKGGSGQLANVIRLADTLAKSKSR